MKKIRDLYSQFTTYHKEISHLSGIQGLLGWDQNVMMPDGAAECRAAQMAALAGVIHEKSTSKDYGRLLKELGSHSDFKRELNEWEQANIRDALRDYEKVVRVPRDLAQRLAELESRGNTVWIEAREKSDFAMFAPVLKDWIALLKQKCHHVDPKTPAYQLLVDDYERGIKLEQFNALFSKLKGALITLIKEIKKQPLPDDSFMLSRTFPIDAQAEFNRAIAIDIGFDTKLGRLDVSVHPFTGGAHPTDVRMTTRYKESDLIEGITGTVHETGHSLYEQGRNAEYFDLPVSQALSMGIHESQSLLWERMVGLSQPFWNRYWPLAAQKFGMDPLITDQFYRLINKVSPGFIRVEADEVTYPLHVILRYEIEKGLFDGTIEVDDLPRIWNQKMKEYLGVEVDCDRNGVLQDTHWAVGLFGYFPTYTLGAIYACQFFAAAKKQLPSLDADIQNGNFKPLKEWLNKNVHKYGSLYPSGDELVTKVTGQPLNADFFLDYLRDKYSKLYGVKLH